VSLLFNGKTQLRNVLGNAFMVPIANIVDTVGTPIDFMLSKKSGVRTTGLPQYRAGAKGAWRGIKNALFNFNNDIDSRALSGDKFDIGRGNAFNPAYAKNGVTRKMFAALNMVDRVNSFLLDIGDRVFFQAYFDNSIANQLRLNKTQDITPEMIEIAQYEALERTWQDNNGVTRALKKMQDFFNGGKDFGFGNIILPFTKTPANLMKAIVEYSPIGLTKALITDLRLFNLAQSRGEVTPMLQKKAVNGIGKGVTGTILMLLGYFMAAVGIITGSAPKDKDMAAYQKNVLGIQPYSIKIGNKYYSYAWAEPVGSVLSVAADIAKGVSQKDSEAVKEGLLGALQGVVNMVSTGGNLIFEKGVLQGVVDVFKADDKIEALLAEAAELPSQLIPTIIKQFADITDPISRRTYSPDFGENAL
ncbi:MAG: hypothetical protein RR234_10705, partial [Christensenella sp.]